MADAVQSYSDPHSRRERYESYHAELKRKRKVWDPVVRDICEQMAPYRIHLNVGDQARGQRKDAKILNSTPLEALDVNTAGCMAAMTNPTLDWYDVTIEPRELAEQNDVKAWLKDVYEISKDTLLRSNCYQVLANDVWPDGASICTAPAFIEEDEDVPGGVRFYPMIWGEYSLDANHKGEINACFRELEYTVRQVVEQFGLDACSPLVRDKWRQGKRDDRVYVIHAVQQNELYEPGLAESRYLRFASCWWEKGDPRKDTFLRESGYEEFPVVVLRWGMTTGDIYGRGPGWKAIGDCKELQFTQGQKAKITHKQNEPNMQGTEDIASATLIGGDITWLPRGEQSIFKPTYVPDPEALRQLREDIAIIEERIKRRFNNHVWQALMNDTRAQRPTATEVDQIKQEVMLMLGPLVQTADHGFFSPLITRVLGILTRNDMLPIPPESIQGRPLTLIFRSIVHRLQRATDLAGIHTVLTEIGQIVALGRPDVLAKLNVDKIANTVARIAGVDPDLLHTDEEAAAARKAQADAEAAKAQGEAMLSATQGVKNLGSANAGNLREVASTLSPAVAAQAGVV